MLIQWYPGHMAKARRMLIENLKLIDVVVELVDARAPLATRNPDFDDLFESKERVVVLNKSDLAAPESTKRWIEHYKKEGIRAVDFVATSPQKRGAAVALIENAASEKVRRMREKGVNKTVRAMIVGIPNVGKSTFINRIAGMNRTQTGDKPGVTKGKQWVKITPYLELMDTPGLLWPKLENEALARHLAYIGSINDETMDVEALAQNLLCDLRVLCPAALYERYKKLDAETEDAALLDAVAQSRGFVMRGGEYDTARAARIALDEYRGCKIARVTLEEPGFLSGANDDGKAE